MFSKFYISLLSNFHPRTNIFEKFQKKLWLDIYKNALEFSENLPPTKINRLQKTRLNNIILYAKENIPFYSSELSNVSNADDLNLVTPITKKDIREALNEKSITNDRLLKDYGLQRFTSGSSGEPFTFYHDSNSYVRRIAHYGRLLRWAGFSGTNKDKAIWLLRGNIHAEAGATLFTCKNPEEIESKKEELFKLFADNNVVFHALTSHLVVVANIMKKEGRKANFKAIVSYGETLYPETRKYIESVFQAPVFNFYASQEMMNIANECEVHDGLHVSSEWVYLEILDEQNNPVKPGETGNIVLTSLDNQVMPFIRYKIGDLGYWMENPCPCGRSLPRIKLVGRTTNHYFVHPKNFISDFSTLAEPLLKRIEAVTQFQINRKTKFDFYIKIVPSEKYRTEDTREILEEYADFLGEKSMTELELVDKIPLGPGGKPVVYNDLSTDK